MFYNELLIQGVYPLGPLPWQLLNLCSGGFLCLLAPHRSWTNTCTCSRCKVWAGKQTNNLLLPGHYKTKVKLGSANCSFPAAQEPSQVKNFQSIFIFVLQNGWRTQNTTPYYHFYISLDMTVFSKQYQCALSASNISVLTNFYQIFLWRTHKLPTRSEKLWTPSLLNPDESNPLFGLHCLFLLRGTAHWFVPFSESFPKKPNRKSV